MNSTLLRTAPVAVALVTLLSVGYLRTGTSADAAAPLTLGTASQYSVLAGSTVTNTGPSTLHASLGVSPGTALTGFPPGIVGGATHAGDAPAAKAEADVTTAYDEAAGRAPNALVSGDLVGKTLTPGVYKSSTSLKLSGTLTLNAQGNPAAVFIFQIGSTLTTASASHVAMINGAQGCHVYWQVGSSAILGTHSSFKGNLLALTSITVATGTTVAGRALARNGAVTLDHNSFIAPSCATTPPPTTTPPTTTPPTTTPPTTTPPTTTPPTTTPPTTAPPTTTGPGSTGPGSTGPGSTGPGSTGPGSTGSGSTGAGGGGHGTGSSTAPGGGGTGTSTSGSTLTSSTSATTSGALVASGAETGSATTSTTVAQTGSPLLAPAALFGIVALTFGTGLLLVGRRRHPRQH